MYIHLGGEKLIRSSQIVAIFDITVEQTSKLSKQFIQQAQINRKVESIGEELPKSIVVTKDHIYFSPISTTTLKKRSNYGDI